MSKRRDPLSGFAGDAFQGRLIGYARVSTEEQKLGLQIDALKKAGCATIYEEKLSAASKRRPKLDLAMRDLRRGDVLCVWRLDRFARSMRDLMTRLEALEEAGAGFRSLTEGFDTVTANGRLIMMILGALAEFERQLTVERTHAGIAAARARGVHIGAVEKFTPALQAKAIEMMRDPKLRTKEIAERLGISVSTINNRLPGGRAKYLNSNP